MSASRGLAISAVTRLASGTENLNPPDISFWALVAEDFAVHGSNLSSQGFWALFWHRFGNWRMGVRPKLLRAPLSLIYRIMFKACAWICGICLPYTTRVGRRVFLDHFSGMVLVPAASGSDVTLRYNTTPVIPSRTDLAACAVIVDHVDIDIGAVSGHGAIMGAKAVVTLSVPPLEVVGGLPRRLIRVHDPASIDPRGQTFTTGPRA